MPNRHVEKFMEQLYPVIDIPQFEPTGTLRPFLRVVTAVLIMYHRSVRKMLGANCSIVQKMCRAVQGEDNTLG